jgi:hypothetical protein
MMKKKEKINLEKLARMVERGFAASSRDLQDFRAETSRDSEATANRFSGVLNRLDAIEQHLVFMRTEMKDLQRDTHGEIIDLRDRVIRLEKRAGLRK